MRLFSSAVGEVVGLGITVGVGVGAIVGVRVSVGTPTDSTGSGLVETVGRAAQPQRTSRAKQEIILLRGNFPIKASDFRIQLLH